MSGTDEISKFIEKQQRNFVARTIRMDNISGTKRLLFNNNQSRVPGRAITLYSTVLKSEGITADALNMNAMAGKY